MPIRGQGYPNDRPPGLQAVPAPGVVVNPTPSVQVGNATNPVALTVQLFATVAGIATLRSPFSTTDPYPTPNGNRFNAIEIDATYVRVAGAGGGFIVPDYWEIGLYDRVLASLERIGSVTPFTPLLYRRGGGSSWQNPSAGFPANSSTNPDGRMFRSYGTEFRDIYIKGVADVLSFGASANCPTVNIRKWYDPRLDSPHSE